MNIEQPLKVFNTGRDTPKDHWLTLVDSNGNNAAKIVTLEVSAHTRQLNDFSVKFFPPDFDRRLIPSFLRFVAEKVEKTLLAEKAKAMPVQAGEIIMLDGLEHIVAGIVEGHEHPTVVADWTAPNVWDVPLLAMSPGVNKSTMWSKAIERNRPHIRYGIKDLYGSEKGRKVIIAGSGPSLQVERLKTQLPDGWDIIACNDAYRLLEGRAKYFFCMESEANPKWWSKIGKKTTCVSCVYGHEEIAKQKWNAIRWFASWPPKMGVTTNNDYIETMGALHEQLNCTISAFHLAYLLGYETMVFVGCDFAYTNGNAHYGEPAAHRDFLYRYGTDVNGGLVLTDSMLSLQARCHEAAACWVSKASRKVYNCTEGGIMTGMECKKLAEVLV